VTVVDHVPLVAPFRGSDARYGTNPLCLVMPGTDRTEELLLDMATSRSALGKARIAMNSGVLAPEGSLLDSTGKPTRDPSVMFKQPPGALVAFGEHKGYGLGLFCELLAGVLTGGGTTLCQGS
jgi:hydroxycarboxylate dehydrogenase B